MTLTPGTRLGVYEITALLGAGGMGEVYRATDINLKRSVAIKVLLKAVATDAARRWRIESPLGAIPLSDALPIARQIADALEAAHDKGIVHRDLKPGNVKITPDGRHRTFQIRTELSGPRVTIRSPSGLNTSSFA